MTTATTLSYRLAWTPAVSSDLARFGASWFGWCAERGERRDRPVFDNLRRSFEEITTGAGCLKAPLTGYAERPSENGVSFALEAQVARFAAEMTPLPISTLQVIRRPAGLALAPTVPSIGLARMMQAAAGIFGTEAPLGEFCLPLTGPLDDQEAEILSARLTCLLTPELRQGHVLSEFTLMAYPCRRRRPVSVQRFQLGVGEIETGALACIGPELLLAECEQLRSIA